jgi:hypothetical protein
MRTPTLRDNIGRLLLSAVNVFAVVGPYRYDWNDSHIFSPQWSLHARFHGVVSVVMTSTLASAALWQLWRPGRQAGDGARTFATLIPLAYWGRSSSRPWCWAPAWRIRGAIWRASGACRRSCRRSRHRWRDAPSCSRPVDTSRPVGRPVPRRASRLRVTAARRRFDRFDRFDRFAAWRSERAGSRRSGVRAPLLTVGAWRV